MAFESFLTIPNSVVYESLDFSKYRYRVRNGSGSSNVVLYINENNSLVFALDEIKLLENGQNYVTNGSNRFRTSGSTLTLERELINTAPTQPGAFTQPTGELEIGDTRIFSFGASSDAEGGEITYNVDFSTNGGSSWSTLTRLVDVSNSFVVPMATTLKLRVRAEDKTGSFSPYRESPTYTVTKPKYYWSKYNVVGGYNLATEELADVVGKNTVNDVYSGYVFDNATGNFTLQILGYGVWGSSTFFYLPDTDRSFLRYIPRASPSGSWAITRFNRVDERKAGSLIQSGIIAVEGTYPTDGRHTDGFWYVRGSRVNQSIAPTGAFATPTAATTLKPGQGVSVAFTASTAANISLYELEYRYNSGLWTTVGTNNTALSRSFTPTTDKTLTTVQFRVRAKNTSNVFSDYVYSETFAIEHNSKPTITLTTADNPSLTENANLVLAGQAVDTDNGNVLTVYYQINTGTTTAIATGISNGTTPLTYNKTLQYRQGTLYDGTTSVFANLVGNQTYTLKVWAEDNQGGKSDVQTRSFTVVPNRSPVVTVAALATTTDKINNDSITVNGTVTDPDNQTVVVKYRINSGELVQVYSGAGGNYTFNFKLASLNDGDNIVEIQASDVYGLTTTIRRKFTKTKNKKELLESVVRYRGILPAAGITGVVAWFERENGDLTITPALSLTTTGESESFTNMNLSNTGPVTDTITEEQYQLATEEPKTGMTLKVNLSRTATTSDKGIKKITGALQ